MAKKSAAPVPTDAPDTAPMVFMVASGDFLEGVEMVGMHLGPRTKLGHPYSYDPLLQYRKYKQTPESARTAYSDRMSLWNYKKYRGLMKRHFVGKRGDVGGDYFDRRTPRDIEAYLRDYFGKPRLELVRIEEHCNQSNGYPVWLFFWVEHDETQEAA